MVLEPREEEPPPTSLLSHMCLHKWLISRLTTQPWLPHECLCVACLSLLRCPFSSDYSAIMNALNSKYSILCVMMQIYAHRNA